MYPLKLIYFFNRKSYILNSTKCGFGDILGGFCVPFGQSFTNSSGHPANQGCQIFSWTLGKYTKRPQYNLKPIRYTK
jgi:hypothetical protein